MALEGRLLGEELRAVVRPAVEEADGRLVVLGRDAIGVVAHGDGAARGRDDGATHVLRDAGVEHVLRALDVDALELLGVLGAA